MLFIELAVYGGILNNFSSVFVIPVTEGLGISRGSFSLAVSMKDLVSFLAIMLTGTLLLHFSYRKLVLAGLVSASLSLLLFSFSQNVIVCALASAMLGISGGVCYTAGASRIVENWFWRHRGLVLGTVTMATGLGGSLLCVWVNGIIEGRGWRVGYRFLALLLLAVAVLLVFTLCDRPEQMGLRPYGESEEKKQRRPSKDVDVNWPGYYMKELLRRPTFYLMAVCTLMSCMSVYLTFYVMVAHLQDRGFSGSEAATLQSVMMLSLAVAKLVCGIASDWLGPKAVSVLCMGLAAIGQWLLADISTMAGAVFGLVIYSLALPITSVTVPLLTMSLFGYRAHDVAVGIFLAMVSVGSMLASPLMNLAYDAIGSYGPMFRGAAVLDIIVIGLYLLLFVLAGRDRKRCSKAADT